MVAIPLETHARAKKHCVDNGLVLSAFAGKALEEAMKKQARKGAKVAANG